MIRNLQTSVDIKKPLFSLSYRDKGLFVGSCFAVSLESYLSARNINTIPCPCGILYNPKSINAFFRAYYGNPVKIFTDDDVVKGTDGLWYSWLHHGSIFGKTKEELLSKINNKGLEVPDFVVLTLGTSWIYTLTDSNNVVSNCHKMPSDMFSRRVVSLSEVVDSMDDIINLMPKVKFIITISPIRHLKDGLVDNSYSKSLLRIAVEEIRCRYPERVYYYPSYEIMNDELRDYRFYEEDMLHPTDQAINYIMERFVDIVYDNVSVNFICEAEKIRKRLCHKPLHGEDDAGYIDFRKKLMDDIKLFNIKYPDADIKDLVLD